MPTDMYESPKANVLAVDDDPLLLELLVVYLEDLGYGVIAESSPIHGLKRINDAKIDVLVTDIHMPELNGLELARRARETQPDLPIVFISGYFTSKDCCPTESVLINKPYTRQQLSRGLKQVLYGRSS